MNQIMEYVTSSIIAGLIGVSVFAAFVSFGIVSILDTFYEEEE